MVGRWDLWRTGVALVEEVRSMDSAGGVATCGVLLRPLVAPVVARGITLAFVALLMQQRHRIMGRGMRAAAGGPEALSARLAHAPCNAPRDLAHVVVRHVLDQHHARWAIAFEHASCAQERLQLDVNLGSSKA